MISERSNVYIYRRNGFPVEYRDAVDLYQLAGRNTQRISLYGAGEDAGFCLMLASRFLPEEVFVAPLLLGGSADGFLRCVRKTTPFPFFITAPITFYLPEQIDAASLKKLEKILRRTSSRQRHIEFYRDDYFVTGLFCNSIQNENKHLRKVMKESIIFT